MADFTLAVTGDLMLTRPWSLQTDERFLSLVKVIRDADCSYTHLETTIHDYDGPEIYPCAEGPWLWQRSPRFTPREIKWAGFDIVSHASNHALDYSYGGLYSTWKALDEAGLPYAGTGINLAAAREPAYAETPKGRIALISMASTINKWTAAGETRRDVKGRPDVNPLRFYYTADPETFELVKDLYTKMNLSAERYGNMWLFTPWGLGYTITKFVVTDEPGISTVAEEDDVEGNLISIREARRQADYVVVHLHSHEFDPAFGPTVPPRFLPPFARACIDEGADVFVVEGSHTPGRGLEIYNGKPIFYDPGDLQLEPIWLRHPFDLYQRPGLNPEVRRWNAAPTDGSLAIRDALMTGQPYLIKSAGNAADRPAGVEPAETEKSVSARFVGVCTFGEERKLKAVKLYPFVHVRTSYELKEFAMGVPLLAEGQAARGIIEFAAELSVRHGTTIEFQDGVGSVKLL